MLQLQTDANVRDYLLEAEGKQRKRETQVNKEIRQTLESKPVVFSILNGGVVIVARKHEVDEQKKILRLTNPSIINGSQTQGVLRDFFEKLAAEDEEAPPIHIKYELIVTDDEDLIGEISIARNFQNDVAQHIHRWPSRAARRAWKEGKMERRQGLKTAKEGDAAFG